SAHEAIGQLVAAAMKRDVPLAKLELKDFQAAHPHLDAAVYDVLGVDRAVNAFVSEGSTAPAEVAKQVAEWKQRLEMRDPAPQTPPEKNERPFHLKLAGRPRRPGSRRAWPSGYRLTTSKHTARNTSPSRYSLCTTTC